MITRWESPFTLRSPTLGDLDLNVDLSDGHKYLLVPASCNDRIPLRAERTNIPQADGTIPRRRFTESFITELAVQLRLTDDSPACDQDLVDMTDDLMGWLNSILNEEGRLLWEPYPGYGDERMYDEARWLEDAVWSLDDGGFSRITFSVDTPFPYAIDATQQTITVTSGTSPVTLTNTGNTKHYPVIKVNGSFSSFVIENLTTGEQIEYDGTTVIGGDYAEIDTFRNTIYLNGDQANLKSGLVIEASDFWGLVPGANQLTTDGPSYDVLFNPPWI